MYSNGRVVIVIPSLNPDENLSRVVQGILDIGFTDIVVVDDGSNSNTKIIFEGLSHLEGCKVLHHTNNMGKGVALKTAFKYYIENYDLTQYVGVVTADADGQHLASDIYSVANELVLCVGGGNKCLVLGTRNFDAKDVPLKSKGGNKLTTQVFKLFYGKNIKDTQTGLRGISNEFVKDCLSVRGDRFEYEIKMLITAVVNRVSIFEVPIETVYLNQNRETHFRPIIDSMKIYGVLCASFMKFSCIGLISVLIDQGLFALFYYLFSSASWNVIFWSTCMARIASSIFNFVANKEYVFESCQSYKATLWKYYVLCLTRMVASGVLVDLGFHFSGINPSIVKVVVEIILFILCYKIELTWVFGNKDK